MTDRIDVCGVRFDNFNSPDEAVSFGLKLIEEKSGAYVVTPNPEIVMICRNDNDAEGAVNNASIVLPDGIGIIYGARILNKPLKARIPGIDFTEGLIKALSERSGSLYLFGAKPGVAEMAAENIKAKYPGIRIVGCDNGYFTDDTDIKERIKKASPDFLLVCLGAPKQEKWMQSFSETKAAGLMIGAGGSLDVFAGIAERAPEGFRKLGLEWLYRLMKEPKRIGRMAKLPLFLVYAFKYKKKRLK